MPHPRASLWRDAPVVYVPAAAPVTWWMEYVARVAPGIMTPFFFPRYVNGLVPAAVAENVMPCPTATVAAAGRA